MAPLGGDSPLAPRISFGKKGLFANPDFLAVDDMQEIWWDSKAKGPDEQGADGTGMMMYADGGKRYLPGEMPASPPHAFVKEGAVDIYPKIPAEDAPPDYAPPPGSSAANHH